MNERIKELLEEATEVYDQWYRGESACMVDQKMFAELIIRECIDVVPWQYEEKIKQHFGVEE